MLPACIGCLCCCSWAVVFSLQCQPGQVLPMSLPPAQPGAHTRITLQIPTLTSMLRHATSKSFGEDGYGRYGSAPKPKYVPAVDVPELRRRLADVKALAQQLDVRIQARNWEVDVVDPFAPRA